MIGRLGESALGQSEEAACPNAVLHRQSEDPKGAYFALKIVSGLSKTVFIDENSNRDGKSRCCCDCDSGQRLAMNASLRACVGECWKLQVEQ